MMHVLRHISEHGPTPLAWHERWKNAFLLRDTDPGIEQHLFLCRTFDAATTVDQLGLVNCLSFELMGRQLQLIEERQSERGPRGQAVTESDDAHLFIGVGGSRALTVVCPELREWIAEELRKESSVLKERRKAREEREAQHGGGQGGRKGGKKGKQSEE